MRKLIILTFAILASLLSYTYSSAAFVSQLNTGTLAKTGAYTVVASDNGKTIKCDASSAAFTVTLTAAATLGDGFTVTIIKTNSDTITGTNAVTIDPNGSETINGVSASQILQAQYSRMKLTCDGSNWIASDIYDRMRATPLTTPTGLATSTAWQDVGSVSLTLPPGIWSITGGTTMDLNGASVNFCYMGVSTDSGASFADAIAGENMVAFKHPTSAESGSGVVTFQVALTSSDAYHLKLQGNISSGTPNIRGALYALRLR